MASEVAGATRAPDVSVIIVTYNAPEYVERCLASLAVHASDAAVEVIAVDNASQPSLVPLLRAHLPEASVVGLDENVGFGRACNLAVERAGGRYVLLLNPDAELLPGAIDALVRCADREPRAGVLGGRMQTPEGLLDPKSCWGAPTMWSLTCFATGLSTAFAGSAILDPESLGPWQRDTERDVDIVTGALFLVPTRVWRELGGFDPDYFMYAEDADLSLRARMSGRRVWITPDAVAIHALGASSESGDRTVMLMRGKATYVRKHFPGLKGRVARALLLAGVGLRAAAFRARRVRANGWVAAWARRGEWTAGYPECETR